MLCQDDSFKALSEVARTLTGKLKCNLQGNFTSCFMMLILEAESSTNYGVSSLMSISWAL